MTKRPVRLWLPTAALATACVAPTWTTATPADEAIDAAIAECKRITDDAERLICFDALAAKVGSESTGSAPPEKSLPAPTAAAAGEPAPPSAPPGVVPLTDEVGKERVAGGRAEEAPKYAGTVTRCEESRQSGQTYFFFENGQVWKQANYRRLNLRSCRFDVTVTKDTFGYELHIPSKDRRVRVSRVR